MGAPAIVSLALGLSSELGWWTGRWASAYADATESLRWAQELNQAAAALFVSRKTVEAHLTRAYRKLGVRSRTELARLLLTRDVTHA